MTQTDILVPVEPCDFEGAVQLDSRRCLLAKTMKRAGLHSPDVSSRIYWSCYPEKPCGHCKSVDDSVREATHTFDIRGIPTYGTLVLPADPSLPARLETKE